MLSKGGEQSVKVVLLGDSGVGKSSLALRFVTNEFRPYSEATIGASFMSKSITTSNNVPNHTAFSDDNSNSEQSTSTREISFKIWDTAGQEKYRALAPMYYRGSSAAILVYDITNPPTFFALKDWVLELQENGPAELVMVICGNKLDLEDDRLIDRRIGEEYAKEIGALYVETSAKIGDGVENMFYEVARKVPQSEDRIRGDRFEEGELDLGRIDVPKSSCC